MFEFSDSQRESLLNTLKEVVHEYLNNTRDYSIVSSDSENDIRSQIKQNDFKETFQPAEALRYLANQMKAGNLHSPNPRYMGLFTPRILFPGAVADALTAVFNPNLGSWGHAPFPVELESHLVEEFAKKFGYKHPHCDGVFASGGAEANQYAIICALNKTFPEVVHRGLCALNKQPVIYCSGESHHSIIKGARVAGLGTESVRRLEVDDNQCIILDRVETAIKNDLFIDKYPLMIIGTAGTTGSGAFDDLEGLVSLSRKYKLWFHVDAAYGGAVVLNDELRPIVTGIELSDSITFDLHKWLAAPMGTSLFLTSDPDILHRIFDISAEYMPSEKRKVVDPYSHSLQWSRRAIGIRVYLSLLIYGWEGYSKLIEHHHRMGNVLRNILKTKGWEITNDSILPLVCFTHPSIRRNSSLIQGICDIIVNTGKAWVSTYPIREELMFRACITNYETNEEDLCFLVDLLEEARINEGSIS